MKEIIKPGEDRFITKCDNCGCEFAYELEDIEDDEVECPYCHEAVIHELPKPELP